jgi:hypothetical protein
MVEGMYVKENKEISKWRILSRALMFKNVFLFESFWKAQQKYLEQ